jgi:hypothetical protein
MPNHDRVVVYVATYARLEDARADFVAVTRRYAGGVVRTDDTTVIGKKLDGKLTIVTAEHPDAGKAWIGLGAGELAGLFIPPFLLWDDPQPAGGSTMGSFWSGLSDHDVRIIANMLQHSPAALIVVSQSEVERVQNGDARAPFEEFKRSLVLGGRAAVAADRCRAIGQSYSRC